MKSEVVELDREEVRVQLDWLCKLLASVKTIDERRTAEQVSELAFLLDGSIVSDSELLDMSSEDVDELRNELLREG